MDLDYPRKDGSTLRKHYEQLQRWDWIEAKSPLLPPDAEYIWDWFWDIIGGKGAEEGFWMCLRAWSDMTDIRPSRWEVGVLKRLHGEYMKYISTKIREMEKK